MSHEGYLLIADISGYTDFIKLHNLRKKPVIGGKIADMFEAHAETIISALLEAVIDQIEPVMSLNKLEGDAAFFSVRTTAMDLRQTLLSLPWSVQTKPSKKKPPSLYLCKLADAIRASNQRI